MKRPQPRHYRRFPSVMVSWDNTARRPTGATVFEGATPEAYEYWLEQTVASVRDVPDEENYLFIVAWNEWAEGNHLEPDQKYGRAWLEATRSVLVEGRPSQWTRDILGLEPEEDAGGYDYIYRFEHESAVANAAALVRDLASDRTGTVVDLGAGSGVASLALDHLGVGLPYLGLDLHPAAVERMRGLGLDASVCDLSDTAAVVSTLDAADPVSALLAIDVLEHLVEPQVLLSALSAWALDHGRPLLVVSVPNVSHFDVAVRLLFGRWVTKETGLLDATHLRFYTRESLGDLLARTGWEIVARDDFAAIRSDQFDIRLENALPARWSGRCGCCRSRRTRARPSSSSSGPCGPWPSTTRRPRSSTPSPRPRERTGSGPGATCARWPTSSPPPASWPASPPAGPWPRPTGSRRPRRAGARRCRSGPGGRRTARSPGPRG